MSDRARPERLEQRVPRSCLEIFRHGSRHVPEEEVHGGGEPHRVIMMPGITGEEHFGDGLLPRHRIDDHRDAWGMMMPAGGRRGRSRINTLLLNPRRIMADHKHPRRRRSSRAGTKSPRENTQANVVETASLLMGPTIKLAMATSCREMPAHSMSAPTSMKAGKAMMGKELTEVKC